MPKISKMAFVCYFIDNLGETFELFLIQGHKTDLTKVIWPQYMLISSIQVCFCDHFFHMMAYMYCVLQCMIYSDPGPSN